MINARNGKTNQSTYLYLNCPVQLQYFDFVFELSAMLKGTLTENMYKNTLHITITMASKHHFDCG